VKDREDYNEFAREVDKALKDMEARIYVIVPTILIGRKL